MEKEKSEPALFAYLSYKDGVTALEWLKKAFGFETVAKQVDEKSGKLIHAEVRLGNVVLMIGTNDKKFKPATLKGISTGQGIYIAVASPAMVKSLHKRAVKAGAKEVFAPEKTEWGTWRVRMLDPEGYEWSFGTYMPGQSW